MTHAQRTALRSVIGSLTRVGATRPDLAYRVNALQQRVTTATVETLREANRVVALALNDADRSIVYRAHLPWQSGRLAVVTFCDASFAAEPGHKSQRETDCTTLRRMTEAAANGSAKQHEMHLKSFSSSTVKRVCRAALQCEAYSMQHATEHGDRLRASVLDLQGKLPTRGGWEESTRRSMLNTYNTPTVVMCRTTCFTRTEADRGQAVSHRAGWFAPNALGRRRAQPAGIRTARRHPPSDTDASAISRLFRKIYETLPSELSGAITSDTVTLLEDVPTGATVLLAV